MGELSVSGLDELFAKPDTSLLEHSRQTLEAGRVICDLLGLRSPLLQKALFACALHDIGKATKSFQAHIRDQTKKAFPHALASFPITYVFEKKLLKGFPHASFAVLSHHTPIHSILYNNYKEEQATFYQPALLELLKRLMQQMQLELDQTLLNAKTIEILCSKPPYYFWIKARDEILSANRQDFAQIKAVLQLADWASSGGYGVNRYFLSDGRQNIEAFLDGKGIKLRWFQRACWDSDMNKTLFLRAPTGTGKTEALLGWASRFHKIIYLLPTQTTSNAMHERVRAIFGKQVGLSHGKAWFYLHDHHEEKDWDEHLLATAFAKPVNVATLDQLLLAHLNGRHWEIKETMAQNGALVFDEIHSYEPYTLGVLSSALSSLDKAKKAFASATLPGPLVEFLRQSTGQEGNLIEAEESFWNRKRHQISLLDEPIEHAVQDIERLVHRGQRVLVVLNTVKHAQDIFLLLSELLPEDSVLLLHSRLIYRDRRQREQMAMRPPKGFALVSTQVVEVSLDISYDVLFTQMAPVDALVQRMGRVNRFGDSPVAPVKVFSESEESKKVYNESSLGVLSESRNILASMSSSTPSDREICAMVEGLYQHLFSKQSFKDEIEEGMSFARGIRKDLGIYSLLLEEGQYKPLIRKGMLSVEVIPKQFADEAYELVEKKQAWRLNEITVPVPWWWVKGRIIPGPTSWSVIADIDYHPVLGAMRPAGPPEEFLDF